MKSLFEELGGTYTLGKDGMYYPNLTIDDNDHRTIGKWGRMHRTYLKEVHPGLYERLILNATLHTHLADANERAEAMMELLTEQIKKQEGITEQLKAEQPMVWVGRMKNICSRAEEIVMAEVINSL
ncbi:MAG: TnpV protein [Clostridia bacterium]|nr:TnpV protein [Clostridia bacterium]